MILSYILNVIKIFDVWVSLSEIMNKYDPTVD